MLTLCKLYLFCANLSSICRKHGCNIPRHMEEVVAHIIASELHKDKTITNTLLFSLMVNKDALTHISRVPTYSCSCNTNLVLNGKASLTPLLRTGHYVTLWNLCQVHCIHTPRSKAVNPWSFEYE